MAKVQKYQHLLDGYDDQNEMHAALASHLLTRDDMESEQKLPAARGMIRDVVMSAGALTDAIGSANKPKDREPFQTAVAKTQMLALEMATAFVPRAQETAKTAPNETLDFVRSTRSLLHMKYEAPQFVAGRDELDKTLVSLAADVLATMPLPTHSNEESWLYLARSLAPVAPPEALAKLVERSKELLPVTSHAQSLQWELKCFGRNLTQGQSAGVT